MGNADTGRLVLQSEWKGCSIGVWRVHENSMVPGVTEVDVAEDLRRDWKGLGLKLDQSKCA